MATVYNVMLEVTSDFYAYSSEELKKLLQAKLKVQDETNKLTLRFNDIEVRQIYPVLNKKIIIFHGGCHGCTRQLIEPEGVDFCIKCQYFESNWDLPSFNNEPESTTDKIKKAIKQKYISKETH